MYQNAVNTRKKIRSAMFELLKSGTNLQDINISDLVKKAGISRGSFYNHYRNIIDVANEAENELVNGLTQIWETQKNNVDLRALIKSIFAYLKENERHYKAIVPAIPQYMLADIKNKFLKNFMSNSFSRLNSTPKGVVTILFITNGLVVTYFDYLEGKINVDIDQLCDIYTDIITNLLTGINA